MTPEEKQADARHAALERLRNNARQADRYTADGVLIVKGLWCWDSDLQMVQITEVSAFAEGFPKPDGNGITVWHDHTRGSSDDGPYGRLARRFPGGLSTDIARPRAGETPEQFADRAGTTLGERVSCA
jgi:hypothetical protein